NVTGVQTCALPIYEGFRDRVTKLFTYLEGTRKTLEFLDEDLFYYATLSHIEIPDESSNDVLGEMIFLCSDPYKYSKDESTETLDDTTVIKNEGSEATEQIGRASCRERGKRTETEIAYT